MRTNTTRTARSASTSTSTSTSTDPSLLDGMAVDTGTEPEVEAPVSDADLDDEGPEEATDAPTKREFEKGSWQATAKEAAVLYGRADKAKGRAGMLLWQGATSAIAEWAEKSDEDVNAEALSHDLLVIMGTKRKGDVSKIKKVALAVVNKGLQTSSFSNLSQAYKEATRLLDVAVVEENEDNAADEAVQAVAVDAPKSATTLESAIALALALAGGADEFARATFDAINHGGAENHDAHRSIVRAFAQEAQGRVKAVADAEKAKAEAARAEARAEADKAKAAKADAAATAERATPAKTAKPKPTPTSATKGDANKRPLPAKTAKPKPAPASTDDGAADLDALSEEAPAKPAATAKPKPRRV